MVIVILAIIAFNVTIGWWAVDYSLWSLFGKDILFIGDLLIALVAGQFAVPLAIVCWVLQLFGVPAPFFQ